MAKKKGRRRAAKPRASKGGLSGLSARELVAELRRRQGAIGKLEAKRDRLAQQVNELDREIAEHRRLLGGGGAASGRRRVGALRGRPRGGRESTLADALVQVLSGQVMGVTEVAEAVQSAGYVTNSPNFRTIVNQTLIKDDRIKKVARGQYTAK
ncbi:MAG: hypothetical protein RBS39_07465 [Phycisphaerales bacterium]|jgi:hypothetical protein|nr:hypothetical protein [Phycisphaerales bacterium]